MINREYFVSLMQEYEKLRSSYQFRQIDETWFSVSYMPTKGIHFVGYKCGYNEIIYMQERGLAEKGRIRSDCRNYLKILRDSDGTLVEIQSIVSGRIDVIHQAFYKDNRRYLFPFSERGRYYPTLGYVTVLENDFVTEEYMTDGRKQIIYQEYEKTGDKIKYVYVNAVPDGQEPIIYREDAFIYTDPLRYECLKTYSWWEADKGKVEKMVL